MKLPPHFNLSQLCSRNNEALFFAALGHFFACPNVRRECGGYPLNNTPLYQWFVIAHHSDPRIIAFASVEPFGPTLRWREAYVTPHLRQRGLFRALRQRVLNYADQHQLHCTTRVRQPHAPLLLPHGFVVISNRGKWTTLQRNHHDQ